MLETPLAQYIVMTFAIFNVIAFLYNRDWVSMLSLALLYIVLTFLFALLSSSATLYPNGINTVAVLLALLCTNVDTIQWLLRTWYHKMRGTQEGMTAARTTTTSDVKKTAALSQDRTLNSGVKQIAAGKPAKYITDKLNAQRAQQQPQHRAKQPTTMTMTSKKTDENNEKHENDDENDDDDTTDVNEEDLAVDHTIKKAGASATTRSKPGGDVEGFGADNNGSSKKQRNSKGPYVDHAATTMANLTNIESLVGPKGISQLTKETQKLVNAQQEMFKSIEGMAPMMKQVQNMVDGLGGADAVKSWLSPAAKTAAKATPTN